MDEDLADIENELFEGAEPVEPIDPPEPAETPAQAETGEEGPKPEEGSETPPTADTQEPDATQEPTEPEPVVSDGTMPYGAYRAEKDKRQEAQAELEKAKAETKRLTAQLNTLKYQQQQAQQPAQVPDVLIDPDGYSQHLKQEFQQSAADTRMQINELAAKQALGNETVDAAMKAAEAALANSPWLAQRFQMAPNPHIEAVTWHKEQQLLAQQAANPAPNPQPTPAPTPAQSTTPAPVIPPNNSGRASAAPNRAEPSMDDIEAELWGNR